MLDSVCSHFRRLPRVTSTRLSLFGDILQHAWRNDRATNASFEDLLDFIFAVSTKYNCLLELQKRNACEHFDLKRKEKHAHAPWATYRANFVDATNILIVHASPTAVDLESLAVSCAVVAYPAKTAVIHDGSWCRKQVSAARPV